MTAKYKVGDVVQLNSGGPKLTITWVVSPSSITDDIQCYDTLFYNEFHHRFDHLRTAEDALKKIE